MIKNNPHTVEATLFLDLFYHQQRINNKFSQCKTIIRRRRRRFGNQKQKHCSILDVIKCVESPKA